VAIAAILAFVLFGRSELADAAMVFLLSIVVAAMRFGYGPSILAAVLSVATFDFFFVPPIYTLSVSDARHIVTFAVMFVVAIVISNLTKRIREQADAARVREQRTASLYTMTRDLATTRGAEVLLGVAVRHLQDIFASSVVVFLPKGDTLERTLASPASFAADEKEREAARWVWEHDEPAGMSTDTLPSAGAFYVPLKGSQGKLGVLGVAPSEPRRFVDPDQRQLLDTFASQIAGALERVRLAEEAQRAHVDMETERMRSSLLSSVSHDLRTPLAVVTGAASTLLEDDAKLRPEARRDLLETIHEETNRLARVVSNLLDMTRLASGTLRVKKEWQPLEEVVGAALGRVEDRLGERKVDVSLPDDLPLVPLDAVLLEQVLINLLENAGKYTPEGKPIEISARSLDRQVLVEVADRGPGIPKDEAENVFEKFYRLPRDGRPGGAGLGLAICRGVVEAHGGKMWVENRDGGGAAFRFTLPIEGTPPAVAA
jgi:two-component system sensor histidine kinase KdpD